jgi:hypothetical protein
MAKPRRHSLDLDFDLGSEPSEQEIEKFRPKCFGDYDQKVCGEPEFICGKECGAECVVISNENKKVG